MYIVTKYKNKWSVFDTKAKVYYFIGMGKSYCTMKANQLNRGC